MAHLPFLRRSFYGVGNDILSTGHDRSLRTISVVQDARGAELSQGSVLSRAKASHRRLEEVRLPPIVSFAAEPVRQKDWANIVTCHMGHADAYTWSFENRVCFKVGGGEKRKRGRWRVCSC